MAAKSSAEFTLIRPLGNRIVVKREESPKQIGRILLPDNTEKPPPAKGVVLAVGPGELKGDDVAPPYQGEVLVGDKVFFRNWGGNAVTLTVDGKDEEFLVLDAAEVLAVIRE